MPDVYDKIADSYISASDVATALYPKPATPQYPFSQYLEGPKPEEEEEEPPEYKEPWTRMIPWFPKPQDAVPIEPGIRMTRNGKIWKDGFPLAIGRVDKETGQFTPTAWAKGLETIFTPLTFVGAGIGYLGEEIEKRAAMTGEEWEAYEEAGLPVSSPQDLKKFLPGGEYHERLIESPWLVQMGLSLPLLLAAGQAGLTATAARRGLAPAAAAGKPAVTRIPAEVARGALAPVAAAEAVPGLALKYGVVWPVKQVAVKGVGPALRKSFELALDQGLDKWLVRQGIRADQAPKVVQWFMNKNRYWLFEQGKQNLLKKRAGRMNVDQRAATAAEETMAQAEPKLLEALTGSGVRAEVAPEPLRAPSGVGKAETERLALVRQDLLRVQSEAEAGTIPTAVANKQIESLNMEIANLERQLQPAILPTAEPGMPEAGLQPSMLEQVADKEVRPPTAAKITQAQMDDYVKIQEYAATIEPETIGATLSTEIADTNAEIAALEAELAKPRVSPEWGNKAAVRRTIAEKQAEIAIAEALAYVQSSGGGLEEALDLIRGEMGQISGELGNRSLPFHGGARAGPYAGIPSPSLDAQVTTMQSFVDRVELGMSIEAEAAVETPIGEVPAAIAEAAPPPPPTEPPAPPPVEPSVPPGAPEEDAVKQLTRLIRAAKPVRKETEILKHEELSRRAGAYAGVLEGGEGELAFQRALGVLKGELPQAVFEPPRPMLTPDAIGGLFNTIRDSDLLPFQKLNTAEALSAILGGQLPTRGDISLLENMFGSDLARALLSRRPMSQKAWDAFLEVWNIPRTLMASGELSGSLRQGAFLAPSHPRVWGRSMWAQLRAVAKEENALAIDRQMQTNPRAEQRAQYGVFHAPIKGVGAKLTQREEVFISNFFERFVSWWEKEGLAKRVGTLPLYVIAKGVRISERAYITFLNKLRADTFDTTMDTWEKTGVPPKPDEIQRLANFVNNATGRGTLGKLEESAPLLSGALFSPRLQASRIGLFWDAMKDAIRAANDMAHGRPVNRMARENLKAVVAFVSTGLLILGLAKLNGAEVSSDPNSADFGKIKIGKTRIDIWSSFQPYARFTCNMITGMRTSTITGQTAEVQRMTTLKNFLRSKLMPTTGFIYDALEGRTYEGEDIELSVEQVSERLLPMFFQDMMDAIQDEGLVGGFKALPGFLGIGIMTYDLPSWPELEEYFNIKDTVSPSGEVIKTATKNRIEYRERNPENEAKLFILGRFTTLKTDIAKTHVLRIMEEHKIKPEDVRGYQNVFGKRGARVPEPTVAHAGPPEGVSTWQNIRADLGSSLLQALDRLWYQGGSLTQAETTQLQKIHSKYPLGQTNFNAWVKQTLRQIHENAAVKAGK